MHVARVAVRIGETTIDHVFVRTGERFRIGSLAGAHVAVAGIGSFPLVTGEDGGFVVRSPIGTGLVVDGRATDANELRLVTRSTVTVVLGLATVQIELATLPRVPVPRPRPDMRPIVYTGVALIAHLAVWRLAIEHAPDTRSGREPRRARISARQSFAPRSEAPVPRVDDKPAAAVRLDPSVALAPPAVRARSHAPDRVDSGTLGPIVVNMKSFDDLHLEDALQQVGELYLPDQASEFGSIHVFDPDTRAGFAAVPTESYSASVHGPRKAVELCASSPGCQTSGPITEEQLRSALTHALGQLAACYATHFGDVTVEMTIDASGKPRDVHSAGRHDVAPCAANVIAALEFPASAASTSVTIPLHR